MSPFRTHYPHWVSICQHCNPRNFPHSHTLGQELDEVLSYCVPLPPRISFIGVCIRPEVLMMEGRMALDYNDCLEIEDVGRISRATRLDGRRPK